MEIGIYSFGELIPDPLSGDTATPETRIYQLLELARQADQGGLDVMGVGEHHNSQFAVSSSATLLAAMASVTARIRLTSATTLLATADPVRIFEDFATADLVSHGRTELIFGRGAFTEQFPLFGYRLEDYDALFTEKLQLFAALNRAGPVSWTGQFRPPLRGVEASPRPVQRRLPVWVAAGSPATVTRAATLGYPLVLPLLGGTIAQCTELASLYRSAWVESGRPVERSRIAIASHLFVGESSRQIREEFLPRYAAYLEFYHRRRLEPGELEQIAGPGGALVAGTPDQVTRKLGVLIESTGCDRYLGQLDIGGLPFELVSTSLGRYAALVAPAIRQSPPSALSPYQPQTQAYAEETP